jgi:ankyrin repeat protein
MRRDRRPAVILVLVTLASACTGSNLADTADSAPNIRQTAPDVATSQTSSAPESGAPLADRQTNDALIGAAWANNTELAAKLIAAGADVNHKDDTTQSAYLVATSEGYGEFLELTLANGADVTSLDSYFGTGLIRAAERGHAHIIGRLLQANIDVDHINNLGWTAMHEAIIFGDDSQRYVDSVRLLVAGRSDLSLPTRVGTQTPIELAEAREQVHVAETLRRAESHQTVGDYDALLRQAASEGDADLAAIALGNGADIETRDDRQRTPLLLATTFDRHDVARLLVALGADPDALDNRHDTPFLVTGVTGNVEMLEIILAAAPDTKILNRFGGTALIPASERGHVDYVRRASETDMDINHVNDLGWTALMEAVLFGDGGDIYQQIVVALLDAGADPSIADSDGTLPAEHAERRGHEAIVGLLSP